MVVANTTMTAEIRLLDMLNRIKGMRQDTFAIQIKISALSPNNQSNNQIQMTISLLNELITRYQAYLFIMANKDIVLIGRLLTPQTTANTIQAVRQIFQADPLSADTGMGFIRYFNLEYDLDELYDIAHGYEASLKQAHGNSRPELVPLAPEHLDAILRNIQGFNILRIIRRQEAVQVSAKGHFSSLFLEYFTSMNDLKKAIAPDVDVLSNRWLFQHLSETLDARMLGIASDLFEHTPKKLSLNLNISTIFTPTFESFLSRMPESMSFVVEVQLMDIVQNMRNFFIAKDLLHEAGHQLLIDGLHASSFEFLDMSLLNADLMKLNWTAKIKDAATEEKLNKALSVIDPSKIILMRCEDQVSLKWALTHRINKFQGYFIDSLCGVKAKQKCPQTNACTLPQCVLRKARIAGAVRSQCLVQKRLDNAIEDNS